MVYFEICRGEADIQVVRTMRDGEVDGEVIGDAEDKEAGPWRKMPGARRLKSLRGSVGDCFIDDIVMRIRR